MLEHWLKNAPIRTKFAAVSLLTTIFALGFVLAVMLAYEYRAARSEIEQKLEVEAHIISENSESAIVFHDAAAAHQILHSLTAAPSITQAVIYLPDGRAFAEYHHDKANAPQASTLAPGIHTDLRHVRLYRPISMDGQNIGHLYIEARLDKFYDSLWLFTLAISIAALVALAISFSLISRVNRAIAHPLIALANLMRHVTARHDYSLRSDIDNQDEIGDLARGFNRMLEQIQHRDAQLDTELDQRKLAEKRLNQLAYYDNTTQLPNRHYFKERLEQAVHNIQRYGGMCGLMFIDLDDFKIVNDTLGHHIGDELLKSAALRLVGCLRTGDIVCRIGGDEFAVILDNINDATQTDTVADKIIEALSQPMKLDGKEVFIGASIGISLCPDHASDMANLLRTADSAMYRAKESGKNCYQRYQPDMEYKAKQRFTLENALRRALDADELRLHYQPQIDIASKRIIGAEALLRWEHPELGLVSPVEFIPIAEETGLIIPIGEWVLQKACHQATLWQQELLPQMMIGVNLSARQMLLPDIAERILRIAEEAGLPPELLDIELTESVLMDNSGATISKMEKLRKAGVRISIDDFGTGYSSISYLKRFPITTLKIDRSFIRDVPGDSDDAAITQAIIAMGTSLRMNVIAEGVESQSQLDFLRHNHCGRAQGYLFGQAMSATEMENLLRQQAVAVTPV